MSKQTKSKHHGKPKLRKTVLRQEPQKTQRSELERAEELARVVREARARAEAQPTRQAEEKARLERADAQPTRDTQQEAHLAREASRARQIEPDRDPIGRMMVDALCRGCGVSDILERSGGPKDTPAETLRRAQRLDGLLAEMGPRPREDGGAGKSARTMQRTHSFLAQLIAGVKHDLRRCCDEGTVDRPTRPHSLTVAGRV